ncbi:putative F-box protein PP2-B6 [Coffea arabica]|uniref:F-box protein PP2-B6 n=1 Tax=Coffea arabica TaxID=13443 RepID=A0ABM4X503_COFAR
MGEDSDGMQSRTRFFDMNNDCISLIFSLISPQDLCSASRISKHFKLASESDTTEERALPSALSLFKPDRQGSPDQQGFMRGKRKETIPTCSCGSKTNLKISWTDRNPTRRYVECANGEVDGCGYWNWYDGEMCERSKQVIPRPLRRINRLETKNETLQQQVLKLQKKAEKMEIQVKNLKEKLERKNGKKWSLLFLL